MANVSYQATSNSIGAGIFTFNEDVSAFLSPGQVFDGYINHEWVHVWDGGEEGQQSDEVMEYEDNTCTYIGDGVFSRDAVELSSNANDFVDFTEGMKEVLIRLGDDAIIPDAFELPTTLNVNAVNVNTPPTAYGVSISTNRIGINVASASMGIHLEKDDAQFLQYDTGAVISDLRPAWLTGPSGADWRVSSTNNTTTPLPNEINRLLLTPAGVLNVNGSVMVGANIVINTTSVAAGANVIMNATQIVAGVSVMNTTQIAVGANVIMNTTAVAVGTNIMNATSVSGGSLTATQVAVGANVLLTVGSFKVGNSTANVVITGTAITLANTTQTLDIGQPRVLHRKITASGTYTPTAGTRYACVEIVGGGGAGGGADATAAGQISGGAGGGAGGYVRKMIALPAAASVTIGAAGAGSAGNAGGNGGDSTYDDGTYTLIANGGDGASMLPATTQDQPNNGGTPGGASGGDINMGGNPGGSCHAGATRFQTGPGGGSYFGGGGLGASCASSTSTGAGSVGSGNGSGGGGAVNAGAHGTALSGGAGKAGMCIITEYVW